MQTRTIIDRIEIEPQTGTTFVRMLKQIVDGDRVLSSEYHRTTFPPDGDVAAQAAVVNAHLATMGFPSVSLEDEAILRKTISLLTTHRAPKAQDVPEQADQT